MSLLNLSHQILTRRLNGQFINLTSFYTPLLLKSICSLKKAVIFYKGKVSTFPLKKVCFSFTSFLNLFDFKIIPFREQFSKCIKLFLTPSGKSTMRLIIYVQLKDFLKIRRREYTYNQYFTPFFSLFKYNFMMKGGV